MVTGFDGGLDPLRAELANTFERIALVSCTGFARYAPCHSVLCRLSAIDKLLPPWICRQCSTPLLRNIGNILHMRLHGFPFLDLRVFDFAKMTIDPHAIPVDKRGRFELSYISSIKFNFTEGVAARQEIRGQVLMRGLTSGMGPARNLGTVQLKWILKAAAEALRDELCRSFYNLLAAHVDSERAKRARLGDSAPDDLVHSVRILTTALQEWRSLDQREMLSAGYVSFPLLYLDLRRLTKLGDTRVMLDKFGTPKGPLDRAEARSVQGRRLAVMMQNAAVKLRSIDPSDSTPRFILGTDDAVMQSWGLPSSCLTLAILADLEGLLMTWTTLVRQCHGVVCCIVLFTLTECCSIWTVWCQRTRFPNSWKRSLSRPAYE